MAEVKDPSKKYKHTIGARGLWYSPLTESTYSYQSAYEREFMRFLDDHNIKWVRNKDRFKYKDEENKEHYYIPDFFLPDYDLYVETKGCVRHSDPLKFEAFPDNKKLVLLLANDLQELGLKVFNPELNKNRELNENKWPLSILHKNKEWLKPGILTEEIKKKIDKKKLLDILQEEK